MSKENKANKKRKKYRKYKIKGNPGVELKKSLKRMNWKLIIQLAAAFISIFGVYQTALYFEFHWIMPIYYAALIILILIFLFLNKGVGRGGTAFEQLPPEWSDDEKNKYLEKDGRDRAIAKKLLIFIIPLLLTFAIDILYLNFS